MHTLTISTTEKTELVDVTALVREAVTGDSGSLVTVFVPHTTAGVVVQASGEGAMHVATDVAAALERLVDESGPWRHTEEGDANPWAHVRAAVTASSVSIPLDDGVLALGELQSIFLCELDGPRERTLYVAVS
jgi:secondary thiamine-phosphate synthase enzyme